MKDMNWSLLEVITQGHPWSRKMLDHLKQRYYCLKLATQIQAFKNNCQTCIRSKPIANQHLRPPLQKIYDPSTGPEHLLKINLVRLLPPSNGSTNLHTAVDVFSRYMFAIPLRRPDAPFAVKGLMSISTRHAYVSTAILTDKGTTFTAEVVKQTIEQSGISNKNAKPTRTNHRYKRTKSSEKWKLFSKSTLTQININGTNT